MCTFVDIYVCVCVWREDHFRRIRVKEGISKEKMRGDRISLGVSAATGRSAMLNDYIERKKDTQRSHHSQLVELAGLRGLWRSGLGYCGS